MKIEVNRFDLGNPGYALEVKINNYKYRVTFTDEYYKKLTNKKISPEKLVRKSFEFLLEREGPQSILPEFDLSTIQKYFPEYESQIFKDISG